MKLSKKQKQELVVAWLFAIPAGYALFKIKTEFVELEMASGGGEDNAALFPGILSCLLLFFVVLKTVVTLVQAKRSPSEEPAVAIIEKQNWKKLAMMVVAFVAYIFGLSYIGYYISTPLALIVFFLILGVKNPLVLLGLSGVTTAVIWYVFSQLLQVVLPVGELGLFF